MSPWILAIVAYWTVAFYVAHKLGCRLRAEGLRTRAVERRPGVGDVRVMPSAGDAQNASTRAQRR